MRCKTAWFGASRRLWMHVPQFKASSPEKPGDNFCKSHIYCEMTPITTMCYNYSIRLPPKKNIHSPDPSKSRLPKSSFDHKPQTSSEKSCLKSSDWPSLSSVEI